MSRIDDLNRRYKSSAAVARDGVEILAVGDPTGARLDLATRQLLRASQQDGPGLWDDVLGAVKSLRSRVLTHPQPIEFNPFLTEGVEQVRRQVSRLRGAVANNALLDELVAAARGVGNVNPAVGDVLLASIREVGASACVVIAASNAASVAMGQWLGNSGIGVLTVGELELLRPSVEQSYVVGPPRFFRSSIITAPVTMAVSFVMPAWFRDRQIPRSPMAPYADGAICIRARVFTVGDGALQGTSVVDDTLTEDELLPQPKWSSKTSPDREPANEEVRARKLLLSGGLAMWLDEGERIRGIDPRQPEGERVTYVDITSVRAGTYLLLRRGETEHDTLYGMALNRLGDRSTEVKASQDMWKGRLRLRLIQFGYGSVVHQLESRGVKAATRARAWAESTLVRPNNDNDFEQLLQWLDLDVQPSFGNATLLRRMIYRVAAEVREQLEAAVSKADLSVLERDGHLLLDTETTGFRGIIATRVLAISPFTENVARNDVRMPFVDRGGLWLE